MQSQQQNIYFMPKHTTKTDLRKIAFIFYLLSFAYDREADTGNGVSFMHTSSKNHWQKLKMFCMCLRIPSIKYQRQMINIFCMCLHIPSSKHHWQKLTYFECITYTMCINIVECAKQIYNSTHMNPTSTHTYIEHIP